MELPREPDLFSYNSEFPEPAIYLFVLHQFFYCVFGSQLSAVPYLEKRIKETKESFELAQKNKDKRVSLQYQVYFRKELIPADQSFLANEFTPAYYQIISELWKVRFACTNTGKYPTKILRDLQQKFFTKFTEAYVICPHFVTHIDPKIEVLCRVSFDSVVINRWSNFQRQANILQVTLLRHLAASYIREIIQPKDKYLNLFLDILSCPYVLQNLADIEIVVETIIKLKKTDKYKFYCELDPYFESAVDFLIYHLKTYFCQLLILNEVDLTTEI